LEIAGFTSLRRLGIGLAETVSLEHPDLQGEPRVDPKPAFEWLGALLSHAGRSELRE
jgi:hypothetical protein